MPDEVRYKPSGDNKVLRHVLRLAWDLRCYWCRNFKDYLDLEIDHILPQESSDEERERLKTEFNLPSDYEIHALYNLAPICSDCNKLKRAEDLTEVPVVKSKLNLARGLADKVAKRVTSFGRPSKLGEALLTAAEVDLSDPVTRATFEEGAPAIVQRLAELDEGMADYFTHREVTVEARDEDHSFFVRLNEHGRAAIGVLEQVAGGDLADALAAPVNNLFHQTEEAIADALRGHDEGLGAPEVGSVSIDWPTLSIDAVRYTAVAPAQIEFEFEGAFEGLSSASVARDASDGDGLEDVQGDATFSTRFKFDLTWEPSEGAGSFYFDQVWLEDFDADTLVDGRSSSVHWDWPEGAAEPDKD